MSRMRQALGWNGRWLRWYPRGLRWSCLGLVLTGACFCTAQESPQQETPQYVSPSDAGPRGSAPGMRVKLLSESHGQREFAVIFRQGDEPYAGLTEFAAKYHVESAHFTAIGGFHDARLAWFDEQKKMFRVIPIDSQAEVVSLIGDIALLNGTPSVHMHCVVALPNGETRGGHILGAHVSPLLEVFVTAYPKPLRKRSDPATGLSQMDPDAQ